MISPGDKVRIVIDVLLENGLEETVDQKRQLDYILEHPEEIYTVASVNCNCLANVSLKEQPVSETSFYEEELQKI